MEPRQTERERVFSKNDKKNEQLFSRKKKHKETKKFETKKKLFFLLSDEMINVIRPITGH